ncbi:MAG: hypothetical protein WCK53_02155, partial [Methanomicrobiales archaeon]
RTRLYILSILLLVVSFGLTVTAFLFHWPFFFCFLFIPLVPFLQRRAVLKCPACGWTTSGNEHFCPYDGSRLEGPGGEHRQGDD